MGIFFYLFIISTYPKTPSRNLSAFYAKYLEWSPYKITMASLSGSDQSNKILLSYRIYVIGLKWYSLIPMDTVLRQEHMLYFLLYSFMHFLLVVYSRRRQQHNLAYLFKVLSTLNIRNIHAIISGTTL